MQKTPYSIIVSGAELAPSAAALIPALRVVGDPDRARDLHCAREDLLHVQNLHQAALDSQMPFYKDAVEIPIEMASDFVDGLGTFEGFAFESRPSIRQVLSSPEIAQTLKERRVWSRYIKVIGGMRSFMKKNLP